MFGLFKTPLLVDEELGELRRSGGLWRGNLRILSDRAVPIAISGSRAAPDPRALELARTIKGDFPSWQPLIGAALFEHYAPYAEAIRVGEETSPGPSFPAITDSSSVWSHATIEYASVIPLSGELTIEIGLRTAWDEEHTLGARIEHGKLIELCGSVLAP